MGLTKDVWKYAGTQDTGAQSVTLVGAAVMLESFADSWDFPITV